MQQYSFGNVPPALVYIVWHDKHSSISWLCDTGAHVMWSTVVKIGKMAWYQKVRQLDLLLYGPFLHFWLHICQAALDCSA